MNSGNDNNVDVHIRGTVDGSLKGAAAETRSTIADLKEDVVARAAEMAGASGNMARAVAGVGTAFLGVAAAAYVTWRAYSDGKSELREMNLAIGKTGEYSGQSAASLRSLAGEMAATSTLTIGAAKSIDTALAASGRIGQEAFRSVSLVAGDFARVMGTDVAKVAPELVKLFDDPAKGAAELNKTMHFLAAAELEHIERLVRMGEVGEAQAELAVKLKDRLGDVVPQLGTLERAWDKLRGAASRTWDAMMDAGRPETLEDKLKVARTALMNARAGLRGKNNVAGLQSDVDALEAQQAEQRDITAGNAYWAQYSEKQNYARGLVSSNSINAKARKIDDEIEAIRRYGGASEDAAQAIKKLTEQRAKLFEVKAPKAARETEGLSESKARQQMAWETEALNLADLSAQKWKEQASAAQRAMEIMPESQRKLAVEFEKVDHQVAQGTERLRKMRESGHIDAGVYAASLGKLATEAGNAKARFSELADQTDRNNASWEYGASKALRSYLDEVQNVAAQSARFVNAANQSMESSFVKLATTGKLQVKDLFGTLADEMARAIYRKQYASTVASGVDGLSSWVGNLLGYGGGPGATDSFGNVILPGNVPVAHTGAIVGSEAPSSRSVPMSLFDRAPRFHTGGIAGDEVPIIAKRGEGVFTREQMKALGGSGGGVQVIVNDQRTSASSAPVSVSQGSGGDGMQQIRILIRDEVRGQIGSGQLDSSMRASFGVTRVTTKR